MAVLLACLALLQPMDPATGSRVSLRVANMQDRRITGLNGQVWEPAMTAAPSLTMNLWNGDFQQAVDAGSATFSINMQGVKKRVSNADQLYWPGAPVEIYAETPGTAWAWTLRFKGVVTSWSRKAQTLTITAEVNAADFAKNVLTASYGGTGGIEGGTDLAGRLKPLVIGRPLNVEPVLIDATNSVYQFSGYGAIESVDVLYERGSSFGAVVADYANYSALVAATIPAGRWATCLASGLVRLGAPAYGVITGDVRGHKVGSASPRLSGAVINALATLAGVSSSVINTTSLSAIDTALPYPISLNVTEQITWLDLANQIALPLNCQSGISLTGTWFAAQVTLSGTPAITLNAQGKALPQVIASDELDVQPPYWKTILGAAHCWRVHTVDEIAFTATIVPRGAYDNTATYREGNTISMPDGSTWLYTGATAGSGNPPPQYPTLSNSYWSNLTAPDAPNLVVNPTGLLGAQNWTANAGSALSYIRNYGRQQGSIFINSSTNSATGAQWYQDIPVNAGSAYSLSAWLYAAGVTLGTASSAKVRVIADWFNGSGFVSGGTPIEIEHGTGWTYLTLPNQVAPAGATFARLYIDIAGTGGTWTAVAGEAGWAKIKFEPGMACTPYSDDATYGASYNDGTAIDALKPSEVASDVTSSIVGLSDVSVAADYTGAITDTLPRVAQLYFIRQGVDLTTSASWSVSVVSGTVSASIGAATGLLSLNTSGGTITDSVLEVTATYAGTTRKDRLKVVVNKALPPNTGANGGSIRSTGFTGSINSTTMTAIGSALNIVIGSGGTATLAADYTFTMATSSGGLQMQWYRWNGAAWVALGSAVASTDNAISSDGTPGSGSILYGDTGRTVGAIEQYQLYARTSSGTVARAVSGTETATGS